MLTTKATKRTGSLSGIFIFFLFFCSNGTACECGGDARELIDGRDEICDVAIDDLVATDIDRFNCGDCTLGCMVIEIGTINEFI